MFKFDSKTVFLPYFSDWKNDKIFAWRCFPCSRYIALIFTVVTAWFKEGNRFVSLEARWIQAGWLLRRNIFDPNMTQWNKYISDPKSWTRSVVKFVHRSVNKIMWITSIQTKKQPQALISNVQNQSWTESKLLPHKPWTSNPTLEGCCEGGIYIISSGGRSDQKFSCSFVVHDLISLPYYCAWNW